MSFELQHLAVAFTACAGICLIYHLGLAAQKSLFSEYRQDFAFVLSLAAPGLAYLFIGRAMGALHHGRIALQVFASWAALEVLYFLWTGHPVMRQRNLFAQSPVLFPLMTTLALSVFFLVVERFGAWRRWASAARRRAASTDTGSAPGVRDCEAPARLGAFAGLAQLALAVPANVAFLYWMNLLADSSDGRNPYALCLIVFLFPPTLYGLVRLLAGRAQPGILFAGVLIAIAVIAVFLRWKHLFLLGVPAGCFGLASLFCLDRSRHRPGRAAS